MAGSTGLEPATSGLTVQCANQAAPRARTGNLTVSVEECTTAHELRPGAFRAAGGDDRLPQPSETRGLRNGRLTVVASPLAEIANTPDVVFDVSEYALQPDGGLGLRDTRALLDVGVQRHGDRGQDA
jgi:hypothetical protein